MTPRLKRWLIDVSLVMTALCLFVPIYIRDGQYISAHAEAGKVLNEAHRMAGTNYDRYSEIISDYKRNHESPEFYYQKREAWGKVAIGIFIIPLFAGVVYRRWATCVVVCFLWVWSLALLGVRY
jgi:hypothetical protein